VTERLTDAETIRIIGDAFELPHVGKLWSLYQEQCRQLKYARGEVTYLLDVNSSLVSQVASQRAELAIAWEDEPSDHWHPDILTPDQEVLVKIKEAVTMWEVSSANYDLQKMTLVSIGELVEHVPLREVTK
jgi:hypothetical protein